MQLRLAQKWLGRSNKRVEPRRNRWPIPLSREAAYWPKLERELRATRVCDRAGPRLKLAVMQPINLGSGENPVAHLDRCGALSRLGQLVQSDHCIAQRCVINKYVVVYERRRLVCVGIDFIFAAHLLADRLRLIRKGRMRPCLCKRSSTSTARAAKRTRMIRTGQECILDTWPSTSQVKHSFSRHSKEFHTWPNPISEPNAFARPRARSFTI